MLIRHARALFGACWRHRIVNGEGSVVRAEGWHCSCFVPRIVVAAAIMYVAVCRETAACCGRAEILWRGSGVVPITNSESGGIIIACVGGLHLSKLLRGNSGKYAT